MPVPQYLATTAEVASALGVTKRRVQQLADSGMPRYSHGKYDLLACVKWWYVQATINREQDVDAPTGLEAERERLTRAQADREEIALAKDRGDLIPLQLHREYVSARIVATRIRLLALPPRIAASLENESRQSIKEKLETAIIDVLTALASDDPNADLPPGSPTHRSDRVPEAAGGRAGAEPVMGATAKADHQRVVRKKPVSASRNNSPSR